MAVWLCPKFCNLTLNEMFCKVVQQRSRRIRWLTGAIAAVISLVAAPAGYGASHAPPQTLPPIRPRVMCPTELQPLIAALLRDLPQYINRLSHQRGGSLAGRYAIATSSANLEPLPVITSTPDPKQGGLYQTFFTLLERQYLTQRKIDYQKYFWLFLAHTQSSGWQLAILYTREGSFPANNQVPTPLRDATQEIPGLAVRQWLRDCQAGAIYLPSSREKP